VPPSPLRHRGPSGDGACCHAGCGPVGSGAGEADALLRGGSGDGTGDDDDEAGYAAEGCGEAEGELPPTVCGEGSRGTREGEGSEVDVEVLRSLGDWCGTMPLGVTPTRGSPEAPGGIRELPHEERCFRRAGAPRS